MALKPIDYRSFRDGKGKRLDGSPDESPADTDRRWWKLPEAEIADSITAVIGLLNNRQGTRRQQYALAARLYGNVSLMGPLGAGSSRFAATSPIVRDRSSFNLVQSVIDTAVAKAAKHRPKPMYLTSGGDYQQQRHAKDLNLFVDGMFYECHTHDLGELAFRDGCVFGDGLVHVYPDKDAKGDLRIRMERVLAAELLVDEQEAAFGSPRQMHRTRTVDRLLVAEMFPKKRAEIMRANPAIIDSAGMLGAVADLVALRESWHLPSAPGAKDGLHVLTLDGVLLETPEPWSHDFFPFGRFQWSPQLFGYWGQGLSEQLQGIQLSISTKLRTIQRSQDLGGTFKLFVKNGSRVVLEHLTNQIGPIIRADEAPQYILPPLVQPEIYASLRDEIQRGYQQAGVSEMSAAAKVPAGVDSGKAMRTLDDIGDDRFTRVLRAYERFYLDIATIAIARVRDVVKGGKSYSVKVPSKSRAVTVDWEQIALDDDDFVMQCSPVSSLPSDPTGKLQTVKEYAQAGYLTPRQARRLLDFPDLDGEEAQAVAAEEWIRLVLDRIEFEGEPTEPEPLDDLPLFAEMARERYAYGKAHGLEEERLDLLRELIKSVDALQAPQAQPPALPQVAPANPQAPPTSDLLQNVNPGPS